MRFNNIKLEKAYSQRAKDLARYGAHYRSTGRDSSITRRILWLELLGLMETSQTINPPLNKQTRK